MLAEEYRKRFYSAAATLIMELFMNGQIDGGESRFLLNLLDQVMIKPGARDLIELLKKWQPGIEYSETDEIIKATLLTLAYEDKDSLDHSLQLLTELISLSE